MPDQVPNFVPKLKLARTHQATTYHLLPEGREFGWALCTVNDATGELLICSDWGNWAHRWSADPKHLGQPTLTHFIATRSAGSTYLADKLSRETGPRSGTEFDVDETINELRRMLCEARLEEGRNALYFARRAELCERSARELWEELGSLVDCGRSSELFIERFFRIDGASQWLTSEPWDHLVYTPTTEYTVLLHGILPALVEACAAEVQRRSELADATRCTGHLVHDEFTACPMHDQRGGR